MKKKAYEIKKILKKFKSKNGISLFAYIGIWHGASGDKKIRYIEREDNREYISSFIEEGEKPKYSFDKTLKEEIKKLKERLILEYFESNDSFNRTKNDYTFRCYDKEKNIKAILSELKLLIREKKNIVFNEDYGVGKVHHKKDKYVVELNVYGSLSFPVITKDPEKVVKWLWNFSNDRNTEPFDYGKAMSIAFSKDMMGENEKKEREKNYDKKIIEAFSKL